MEGIFNFKIENITINLSIKDYRQSLNFKAFKLLVII
jgi:hypothetical protein